MKLKKTLVISAYPCCGKTHLKEHGFYDYSILDSDSSKFSWIERGWTESERNIVRGDYLRRGFGKEADKYAEDYIRVCGKRKVRNPNFVEDYINHIKENIGKVDIIFVSSHLEVRQALQDNNIEYITVYPYKNCLCEWVGRMYLRGNEDEFIDKQIHMWDKNMDNIENEPHGKELIRMKSFEHMNDVITKFLYGIYAKF